MIRILKSLKSLNSVDTIRSLHRLQRLVHTNNIISIMAKIITVTGHDALASALKENPNSFVVFYADPDADAVSWCPDCVHAEPVLRSNFPSDAVIVYCYVGDRPTWKDQGNAFRTDKTYALTSVPTVINMQSGKRIVESQCIEESIVKTFFASGNAV